MIYLILWNISIELIKEQGQVSSSSRNGKLLMNVYFYVRKLVRNIVYITRKDNTIIIIRKFAPSLLQ